MTAKAARKTAGSGVAEAPANAARRFMGGFVTETAMAMSMTDRNMAILAVSPKWRADLGVGDADIMGRSLYDLLPGSRERFTETFNWALEGQSGADQQVRIQLLDGRSRWFSG